MSASSLISDKINNPAYIEIIIHSILNMPAQAFSRDRRGTRDHIGHLISVRAVPALGTSLFVVSAYLHAHSKGAGYFSGEKLAN